MKYKNRISNFIPLRYLSRGLCVNMLLIGLYIVMSSSGCSSSIPNKPKEPVTNSQQGDDPKPSTPEPTPPTPPTPPTREERKIELEKQKANLTTRETELNEQDKDLDDKIKELEKQQTQINAEEKILQQEIDTMQISIDALENKDGKTLAEKQQLLSLIIDQNNKMAEQTQLLQNLRELAASLVDKRGAKSNIAQELKDITNEKIQVDRELKDLGLSHFI